MTWDTQVASRDNHLWFQGSGLINCPVSNANLNHFLLLILVRCTKTFRDAGYLEWPPEINTRRRFIWHLKECGRQYVGRYHEVLAHIQSQGFNFFIMGWYRPGIAAFLFAGKARSGPYGFDQEDRPMQHRSKYIPPARIKLIGQFSLAFVILLAFAYLPVQAQVSDLEPQRVTAINESRICGEQVWSLTLEVWNVGSDGGEVYSEAVLSGFDCINGRFGDTLKQEFGAFTGGPDGVVTFERSGSEVTCQFSNGETVQCGEGGGAVFVVQNPEVFAPSPAVGITAEYIYTTYGIRVEDSFGEGLWAQKSWSDQELILLNDVLKELPPALLKDMAVTRIIRSKTDLDKDGNPEPDTFGYYAPCGSPPEKDCTSSTGTIRIFDKALSPLDFSDDPTGDKQFKGTILHELIHALQYKKDEYSIFKNAYSSPLVQNYMDATRPITDISNQGFEGTNGWKFGMHPPGTPPPSWHLFGAQGNTPPTNYGNTDPLEDMSESVMLYMYEPQKLKDSSLQRYNFIRDHIYGGVEYENGTQKKP